MNRGTNLSASAVLAGDILVVARHLLNTLPADHPLRMDFAAAVWRLEHAVANALPVDPALVAVVQFIAAVTH